MSAFAFASAYAGFAALASAMGRYQLQVWRRRPSLRTKRMLQALGCLGGGASLWACVAALGWSLGLVSWLGVATLSSLTLSLTLSYLPRQMGVSSALAGLLAAAAGAFGW